MSARRDAGYDKDANLIDQIIFSLAPDRREQSGHTADSRRAPTLAVGRARQRNCTTRHGLAGLETASTQRAARRPLGRLGQWQLAGHV